MAQHSRFGTEGAALPIDEDAFAAPVALALSDAIYAALLDGDTAASGEIDAAQILRDRPDVFAAFYREFFGAGNDRNSSAWVDRVGGETAEDYARYWYEAHGRFEGYVQSPPPPRAPGEAAIDGPAGRTTADGIPLATILSDRPDVFRAFFTEFYGPRNDRNSDAWTQRVGGTTVEDYANYWYNAHGKLEGYRPSSPQADQPGLPAAPEPDASESAQDPLPFEDPSLDPWNHPAIYPDWQPPFPGWEPPDAAAPPTAEPAIEDYPFARPLVVHYTDDGIELVPATLAEIEAMRTLFDDTVF